MKKISESTIITLCSALSFMFAVIGIGFAVLSHSESVLFDALYSFGAGIFTYISSRAVKMILRGEDRKYQFGYGSFEPFVIVVKSLFMIIMITALFIKSVTVIASGGNSIGVATASVYSALSAAVCAAAAVILKILSRKMYSPLLKAEARSWLYDSLLSTAVLISFAGIRVIQGTRFSFAAVYVDPAVSILFAVLFIPTLFSQFFINLKELLIAAPSEEIQAGLDNIIYAHIHQNDNLRDFETYSTKRGRNLYIVVHIFLKKDDSVRSVDAIRKRVIQDIKRFWVNSDTDIIFTVDPSWIPLSIPHGLTPSETVK